MEIVPDSAIPSASTERTCYRCGAYFPAGAGERICPACRKPRWSTGKEVTPREKQVIELVAMGKANKEIARELRLTEGTVKEYLTRIFCKVGVTNRVELTLWALERDHEQAA